MVSKTAPHWSANAEQRTFIKRYAQALSSGDVAAFAGAGLSRAVGYVDWKTLLKDIADELQLDVDKENDLIAVAQYHLNEKRNRGRLNQTIIDELSGESEPTRCHTLIARLPLPTIWTTNYDQLIERAAVDAGKVVDVKITQENLAHSKRDRDLVLYKMHGCVTQPHEAVVTKDDYEQYERKRPLFAESLKGDLVSKTFLFLGFSFTDPNIDYILSRVRVLLGNNLREHFCVMRSPQKPAKRGGRTLANYDYERRKTDLRQADLRRFGIETVWIDDFSHLAPLLEALSSFVHRKSVFISGAAQNGDPLGLPRLDSLAREIGGRLIRDGFNLVTGFGLGLGEQSVVGALHALYGTLKGHEIDRLVLRPFPRAKGSGQTAQNTKHREDLIARCGVVLVISGNRSSGGGAIESSPGVLEEVAIAKRERKVIIPFGATGHAAREVWQQACSHPDQYLRGIDSRPELEILGDSSATNEQLLNAAFVLLQRAEEASAV